jgi:hypothetical protein
METAHPPATPEAQLHPANTTPGSGLWMPAAFLFCILFATLMVAITDPLGDGSWFWYAVMFRNGQRLYADLHLALQPILPLEFALFQRIFGTRWLPSRLLGVSNALVYAAGLVLVLRFLRWKPWQKALLLVLCFVVTSDFVTFRFDDYHILSACFAVYSIFALLMLQQARTTRERALWLALLGLLSGVCLTNRLNDGAALLACVLFIVLLTAPARRLLSAAVIAAIAALTAIAVILSTGDTLPTWWSYTVTGAAAIKGGAGSVLHYPLMLPAFTIFLLVTAHRATLIAIWLLFLFALLALALVYARRSNSPRRWIWLAACVALLAASALRLRGAFLDVALTQPIVRLLVLAMFVLSAAVLIRQLIRPSDAAASLARRRELLLLVPMGQLLSIAMSAGHWYPNPFPPVAEFLLVLPIAFGPQLSRLPLKTIFLGIMVPFLITALREKMRLPFDWWNYNVDSIKYPRVWYRHPVYGPMLIETSHLDFIQPVCRTIASPAFVSGTGAGAKPELLSLPFTYANYFCAIPPWHGYAQTFFDTSSKQTIETLIAELDQAPPQWILYQRQLDVLRQHELALNAGRPLPHRALDTLIESRVAAGQWQVVLVEQPIHDTSTWYLIRTR